MLARGVSKFLEVTLLSAATRVGGLYGQHKIHRLVCITGLGAGNNRGHGG